MAPSSDHFTPLSRAVASIDRDAYGLRFAVYDREYKAMLRRLAASKPPLSAADLTREENAFHDAVRRVEFGAEDAPTLVPQDEPLAADNEEAPALPLRKLVADEPAWPRVRPPRSEGAAVPPPDRDDVEAAAIEPASKRAARRPVMRRVGERMALAVLLLGFLGTALWIGPRPAATPKQSTADAAPAVDDSQSVGTGAGNNNMRGGLPVLQQPSWMSPQMLYSLPMTPTAQPHMPAPPQMAPQLPLPVVPRSQLGAPAPAPRSEIPLPVRRPEI